MAATRARTKLVSGHFSQTSISNSDMNTKGYFMRQSSIYKIYKGSKSSAFPPGLNPYSSVWHNVPNPYFHYLFSWLCQNLHSSQM